MATTRDNYPRLRALVLALAAGLERAGRRGGQVELVIVVPGPVFVALVRLVGELARTQG